MKLKMILIALLALFATNANAKCADAPDMGKNFVRCENKEAICYGIGNDEGIAISVSISCFKK